MALSVDESPIWLAHHWPDHYDRCVRVGRQHVCRRCLVLYPTVVVVAIVATGLDLGASFGWAPWLLPLPLAVDWIGEHLGRLRYSPTRQIATTLLAAVGFGVALAVHLDRPFAATAVAPVLTYVVVLALVAGVTRGRRGGDDEDWEAALERDERSRTHELQRLLQAADASRPQQPEGDPDHRG